MEKDTHYDKKDKFDRNLGGIIKGTCTRRPLPRTTDAMP